MLLGAIKNDIGEMVNGRLPSFIDSIIEQGQLIAFRIRQSRVGLFSGELAAEFEQCGIALFRETLHMLPVMVRM